MCTFSLFQELQRAQLRQSLALFKRGTFLVDTGRGKLCSLMRWVAAPEMSCFPSLHRLTTLGDQCRAMARHITFRELRCQPRRATLRECASRCMMRCGARCSMKHANCMQLGSSSRKCERNMRRCQRRWPCLPSPKSKIWTIMRATPPRTSRRIT